MALQALFLGNRRMTHKRGRRSVLGAVLLVCVLLLCELDDNLVKGDEGQKKKAALWDEHVKHEFGTKDVEGTLATMVEDAYVNHVPTLTGGIGILF